MSEADVFDLTIAQQDSWTQGTTAITAMLRVTAGPGHDPERDRASLIAGAAEVIVLDCSGSMASLSRLSAAKRAARAAIDAMDDGTEFAVVAGTTRGRVIFPPGKGLARAAPGTRSRAKDAVGRLFAADGTRISSWLDTARELLAGYPGYTRHAILLTDGKNQHEGQDGTLKRVLGTCQGTFTCDARGIGEDWEPADLNAIAAALHGRADGPLALNDLQEDFRSIMREAMRQAVADVTVRVRPASGVTVHGIRQMFPSVAELAGHAVPDSPAIDYWTGSWSGEPRDFLLRLDTEPDMARAGATHPLALIEIMSRTRDGAVPLSPALLVEASWTDDPAPPTDFSVDSYQIQRNAANAIAVGCDRWRAGDQVGAAEAWGQAARFAHEADDTERLRLLETLVHVEQAALGRVRPRDDLPAGTVMRARLHAVTSTYMSDRGPGPAPTLSDANVPGAACGRCRRISRRGDRFCQKCGAELPGQPGGAAT